jgi:TolB-like protein/DNA-binding winged helix-turn-helix (wHTH) protein
MSIIAGQDVLKGSRTKAELSLNSTGAGSTSVGSNGRHSQIAAAPARVRFGRYVLDHQRGCLFAGDREITLRPKTFEFLRYLAGNPGRLVSKDELLAAVWPNVVVTEDSLFQCVAELRRALQDHDQHLIKTVQRRGYRFEAPLSVEPSVGASQSADAPILSVTNSEPLSSPPLPRGTNRARRAVMLAAVGALLAVAVALGASWWWFGLRDRPAAALPPSIVVMPFHNLSEDPDQQYFAAGLTADLTTDLSRLPGVLVIAHDTAQTFKARNFDARQVGRDLNVRYLLEGSVHRSGADVRINVQLIDTSTGTQLWAERFERERDQMAVWQNEIVGRIANTLNLRLTRLESERILRERRDNPEAYDLTTRGWALVYTAKAAENYDAARALFRQALALDRHAVNAWAGIGWSSAVSVLSGWSGSPAQDVATAEAAVVQMLAIDPNHVVAHHVRGVLLRLQGRPDAARDAFRTAVGLNPNFAPSYAQWGMTEIELGRPEDAAKPVERAIRLSPRDPNIHHWFAFIGIAELHLGHFTEAVSWLARAVEADTGAPTALMRAYYISALALAGRVTEARAALTEFQKWNPSASISAFRNKAYSTEPGFVTQRERLYEGLRIAGLSE